MSPTSTGGISARLILQVGTDLIINQSVGNIFTSLGLLAEVNHQLGEEGPRIGLQRLSRFVKTNLFLKVNFSLLKNHLFAAFQSRGKLNGWMIAIKVWGRQDQGLSYSPQNKFPNLVPEGCTQTLRLVISGVRGGIDITITDGGVALLGPHRTHRTH